jgi:tetratricopeptide (TPR) repeat protein
MGVDSRHAMRSVRDRLEAAMVAHQGGDLAGAISGYSGVLESDPRQPDALHYLGVALAQQGSLAEAVTFLGQALDLRPDDPEILRNLAGVLFRQGESLSALQHIDRSLQLDAGNSAALITRGAVLRALGRSTEAVAGYEAVLSREPTNLAALSNLGNALLRLERFDEALRAYDETLFAEARQVDAVVGQASVYREINKLTLSRASYDYALQLDPYRLATWTAKAGVEQALKRFDDALTSVARAAELNGASDEARWNSALIRLNLGQWETGFAEYESRFTRSDYRQRHHEVYPFPVLTRGCEIKGRRVLVHAEQGLGDSLQFCRFVARLVREGADVTLLAPKPLVELFRESPALGCSVESEVALTGYDFHIPLMSLPAIFGTTIESIPFAEEPYLHASQQRAEGWDAALGDRRQVRIGIMWSGGTGSKLRGRSIPLRDFAAIIDPKFDWISLQKELSSEDQDLLSRVMAIRHFGDAQHGFADTAAMIVNCDLVISVDTSVAHLSGALGKETWLLLPHAADWRWLENRDDSVWYPKVRLFRQSRAGDWRGILQRISRELMRFQSE